MTENRELKDKKFFDDYELNHLDYFDALESDKRNYCQIYCSLLKRNQIIMHTFISCNDYNLLNVKFPKFIFIIASIMAMNAFLFADKSFHKLFISGVHYFFKYQILQIAISVAINYIVDIILCFLTMSDKFIYEIKSFDKKGFNGNKIFNILKCIKIKILIFYITTFVIIIFYWYFISAFCAVYPNTQKIYLIDCLLSFLIFLVFLLLYIV